MKKGHKCVQVVLVDEVAAEVQVVAQWLSLSVSGFLRRIIVEADLPSVVRSGMIYGGINRRPQYFLREDPGEQEVFAGGCWNRVGDIEAGSGSFDKYRLQVVLSGKFSELVSVTALRVRLPVSALVRRVVAEAEIRSIVGLACVTGQVSTRLQYFERDGDGADLPGREELALLGADEVSLG